MTQCQRCAGRAQLFGCGTCSRELREMLYGLAVGQKLPRGHIGAAFIENLEDEVWKRTRKGESARRSTERNSPLMVHLDASRLLDNVHAVLMRWVQDLCDSRGVDYPGGRMYPRDFVGPLPLGAVRGHATYATRSAALWLAKNVNAIACDEAFGLCFAEVRQCIDEIERMINRPISPRYCGPCPTIHDDGTECLVGLYAKQDDTEAQCWKCRQVYNAEERIQSGLAQARGQLYTAEEVLGVMAEMGLPIKDRTWRNWRANGKIEPRNEWGSEPRYWLDDVVALRNRTENVARAS